MQQERDDEFLTELFKSGEVSQVITEGDYDRAMSLLPEGRLLLKKAASITKTSGASTFSMNRRVSEDSYIYVLVAGVQRVIFLSAGQRTEPERHPLDLPEPTEFPDFLSGMVTNGTMLPVEQTLSDGTTRVVNVLRQWAPTPNCAKIQGLKTGLQSSTRLAVSPGPDFPEWKEPAISQVEYSQYQTPRASQWSGLMARVVQLVMGLGRIHKSKMRDPDHPYKITNYMRLVEASGVQIRFDYKFMRTHGVVRAADGRLWLVEISAGRGVVAMPLPIFPKTDSLSFYNRAEARGDTAMTTALETLSCLPTGEGFPNSPTRFEELEKAGGILRLLTPAELEPFYKLSGFSSACGWSFSESGDEAHNVGYFYENDGFQRAEWYQISIAIGPTIANRKPGTPLASASACLRLQKRGLLYAAPNEHGVIPVKYHEPMLYPPGLLSHNAAPLYGGSPPTGCDTPVYVGIVAGELKVAHYYRQVAAKPVYSYSNDLDGEPCPYMGTWTWERISGLEGVPPMPYTNDIDPRQVLATTVETGVVTVTPSGYGPAYAVEYIDSPQYKQIMRERYFRTFRRNETRSGETKSACFVNPGYLRDGYYFFEGKSLGHYSGSESVDYLTTLVDPNQGVAWSLIFGGGPPPYGSRCSYTNCGGNHEDSRIMCLVTEYGPCSEFADSGAWLKQCQPSFAFTGSGTRAGGYNKVWGVDGEFVGTWNFTAGINGLRTGPTTKELHDYAMRPSPDPETGAVQQLYALKSALGEETVMHTKGFSVDLVVDGYVPEQLKTMGTFIGVNKP